MNTDDIVARQLKHLTALERISNISLRADNVNEMLEGVLAELLTIFACERAWLLYPCDPSAKEWLVPMERHRDGWPGLFEFGIRLPMDEMSQKIAVDALATNSPLAFDNHSTHIIDDELKARFQVKSQLIMCVRPKVGQAWLLGIHHCQQDYLYNQDDLDIFREISYRIADALTGLITLESLRESEEKHRGLFESMAQGVIYQNGDGIITAVNPAAARIIGIPMEQLIGRSAYDERWKLEKEDGGYFPPEHYPPLVALREKKAVQDVVMGFLTPEDEQRWLVVNSAPKFRPNETMPYEVITTFTDFTELNATKEAAQQILLDKVKAEAISHAKSSFLARMSHEIRTPLTAIIGYAETILDKSFPKEQHEQAARTIMRNGKHLLQIINEILDLSKVEAEGFETNFSAIDVAKLAADIESLLSLQMKEKGLEFGISFQFPLPSVIYSDRTRLKQILLNLCNNAYKFTDHGTVMLIISYVQETQALHFSVEDTGIGLSSEEQTKIFDEYAQANYLTEERYGGTGLGLPISLKLAQKLGGTITVESQPGIGSRFCLILPAGSLTEGNTLHSLHQPANESDAANELQTAKSLKGRILLAEDNLDNQQLIAMYIQKIGAQLTIAENGRDAVARALAEKFDLILMDMQMPIMNGLDALTTLRRNGYKPPIIMLTANAMQDDIEQCYAAGCDGYISKPIDRQSFYHYLGKYLMEDTANELIAPIRSQFQGEDEAMDQLIIRFINSLPSYIDPLEKACQDHDWKTLQSIYHQLKGAGGGYGFPEVTDLAARAENYAHAHNHDDSSIALQEFIALIKRVQKGLSTLSS